MRQRGGFTIPELLVAMTLMAILLALTISNLSGSKHKAETKALANVLADQFRLARQQAMSEQSPVAVVLPSEAGTKPHSQSLYLCQGAEHPKMLRAVDYSTEYPDATLFVGTWGETSGSETISPDLPGTKSSWFPLDTWLTPSMKKEFCFVFTPDGGLHTNDLPYYDGAFHVLVSTGVQYAGAGAPPGTPSMSQAPPYFTPTALGEAYTLCLSPTGAVEVKPGVYLSSDNLVQGPSVATDTPPSAAVALSIPNNHAPDIVDFKIYPQIDASLLPPGADVSVPKKGHVTLVVKAGDTDGDPLFLKWDSNGMGTFSHPGEERMQWDANQGAWVSVWEWRPPDNAVPGQQYLLTCSVRDLTGTVAIPVTPMDASVNISPPGVVAFEHYNAAQGQSGGAWGLSGYEIWTMNPDGGMARDTGIEGWIPQPSVSRDGTKMVWMDLVDNQGRDPGIWIANIDGTGWKKIAPRGYCPSLSPLNDKVAYFETSNTFQHTVKDAPNWGFVLTVRNVDGTGSPDYLVQTGNVLYHHTPTWDPAGQNIAICTPDGWNTNGNNTSYSTTDVFTIATDGNSAPVNLSNSANSWEHQASYNPIPTSHEIVWGDGSTLVRATDTGTLVPFGNSIPGTDPSYSPDGKEILFNYGSGNLAKINANNPAGIQMLTTTGNNRNGSWGP